MIRKIKLKEHTCKLYHDVKRRLLSVIYYRYNKKVYIANIDDVDEQFVKTFDEKMAKEIKSLEIENL